MRFSLALILISSLASAAPADTRLTQAHTLVDDLDPEAALKVLEAIERTEGNQNAVVIEVLLLQGIAWGTLGKDAKTRDSFRKLLMLAPETKLPADLPPRVKTPFFEARDWASKHGPMTVTLDTKSTDGQVTLLSVNIEKDVYRVAKSVRLTVWANDGAPTAVELPLSHAHAEHPLVAKVVKWSVEVIGERKAVLLVAGPRTDGLSPQRDTVASPAPVAVVSEPPAPPSHGWRRPLGIGLASAGAAAVIVGAVFGSLSSSSRTRATPDDTGVVSGVTQREAAGLEKSAIAQATTANVLFGVGAGLAATGLVLIILGPGSAGTSTAALAPAPGGLVLNGTF